MTPDLQGDGLSDRPGCGQSLGDSVIGHIYLCFFGRFHRLLLSTGKDHLEGILDFRRNCPTMITFVENPREQCEIAILSASGQGGKLDHV